ncbi:MAG: helix-turn-helix domain-containing protein [Alphaproteobacteria bacterium]|nr:helix-turn-helix domain-containing protein [Alphaproteobacteria bacterium]
MDRLCYTVPQASQAMALSQTAIWGLISRGELKSIKIGKRRLITAEALQEFIAGKQDAA